MPKKKEPWRASSMLVRANIEHMDSGVKEHLEGYASKKGITLEEATKRALEIVRKIEYHTTQKVKKGEIAPVVTILGAKWPIDYTTTVVSYQLRKGEFPASEEKLLEKEGSELKKALKKFRFDFATKDLAKQFSEIRTEGVANPVFRLTTYPKDVFYEVAKNIMDGQIPDKTHVGFIVHETMDTLNTIPGKHHTELGSPELKIADEIMGDIHNLFSEYGVPRAKKEEKT